MHQGMRKLGLGVVDEVVTVMHSASARFAYARFKSYSHGLWNPHGASSHSGKAVPAPPHAWEAKARRTSRIHEAEQCVGMAEGFA